MKTPNRKTLLAGAALAGLISGSGVRVHAAQNQSTNSTFAKVSQAGTLVDATDSGKHSCKGANACKGQGGCKTGDNGCKGKNSCKGKGGCATDGSKS